MGEGRAHHHKNQLCRLLGCHLPPQENHSKRNKLEGAKRQHCSTDHLLSWLWGTPDRLHPNPPICKITCIHPGRQLNSLGLVMRCWRQKREALYVSKNSHARPLSIRGPLLRSKMTSLEFRHMLVILRSSRSGQRNLKQQVPSRFCAPTRNCIKHRIPTWSIAIMLDPHRDRSCPILPPIRSFDLNHIWEKKKHPSLLRLVA